MYKAVAQLVIMYSSDSWVVMGGDAKISGGVTPPGYQACHGNDGNTSGSQGL